MITTKDERDLPVSPITGANKNGHGDEPYYLLFNGIPLPIAVRKSEPEALEWHDQWLDSVPRRRDIPELWWHKELQYAEEYNEGIDIKKVKRIKL